ncbi:Flp pilus assembly complex ATPase component TadA [Microvirga sp. BT689]|uniref:GspE/PulE family protein n=1 Tax=Microvirga arvi TaxID=2778731 RepID=UPI0019512660|nr:GspE/PulE family protein [Microvirga arvi]MBM6582469.1 Flp pilus assembly complex ATPase component TadA [Microvirga arvi]
MTQQVRVKANAPDPHASSFREAFGTFLLSSGLLDRASIERAQRAASTTGERFDQVLTKLGLLSEGDLAISLGHYLNLPLHTPGGEPLQRLLADKLPASFVLQNRILPVRLDEAGLTLAVVDPLDQVPLDAVRFVTDHAIRHEIITPADFERAAEALYREAGGGAAEGPPSQGSEDPSEHDLQRLRDSASEAPVIRLVNQIIADAVDARASDIYIEPTVGALSVRFRVDGLLRVVHEVPARQRAAVISRIKILARLDIAERRLPQDGRVKLAIRGTDIDFRVATIPTADGETVTLRVLDRSRVRLEFPALGFDDDQITLLQRLTEQPNGIILVTGPTGSGKTTTLYTMLKHVNQPTVKIFTVEDPIEYQLQGISQVQVQPAIDLDFPTCLRAILRHHPDMILIGEIRDTETARIAVQASLTGHLVLSTLHTNSASETVTRLIDMGIEHFLLGSTLRGIIAQRLVRRLCPACSRPHADSDHLTARLCEEMPALQSRDAPDLRQPVGCEQCQSTGFRGQLSIAEIVIVDDGVRNLILQRTPAADIERLARTKGFISMYEDGLAKVWAGLTTIEEVLRVTHDV